ncbi:MAG TPA: hypothetical protein VHQ70_00160 [Syntrophomonadaceae bacterium]|nr:hypothetical protein [Syntrophomonadaceae bacterium]
MDFAFSRELTGEMAEVENTFRDNLLPWWNDISIYHDRMQGDFTWNVLPAVVLSVYKHFGLNGCLAISMASTFKTIYFSNNIHALIKDDEEGQQHDNSLQFAILIGDYIFGTVLKSLVRSGTTNLVGTIAEMICEINEGRVLQTKMNADKNQVLEKIRAPLYGTAFLTAAKLSGQDIEHQQTYHQMGRNLGMSIELFGSQHCQEAKPYIHTTEILMGRCNDYARKPGTLLEKVIRDLHLSICGIEKVAVV